MKRAGDRTWNRRGLRAVRGTAAAAVLLMMSMIICLTGCAGKSGGSVEEETGYEELRDTSEESYGVFLGVDRTSFSVDLFEGYDLVVVDAQELRPEQLAQLHAKGHTVYSYLNVGSIERSRSYFEEYMDCCLDRYENWPDEFWVDVAREEWVRFVSEELPGMILEQDPKLDGLFLDNLDIYSHVLEKKKYSDRAESVFEALKDILLAYHDMEMPVLVNGADVFVSELIGEGESDLISGVNQETVFSRILDYARDRFGTQKDSDRDYYTDYLDVCSRAGLRVFLLEYTEDPELEKEIADYCEENGFCYYIAAHVNLNPKED